MLVFWLDMGGPGLVCCRHAGSNVQSGFAGVAMSQGDVMTVLADGELRRCGFCD